MERRGASHGTRAKPKRAQMTQMRDQRPAEQYRAAMECVVQSRQGAGRMWPVVCRHRSPAFAFGSLADRGGEIPQHPSHDAPKASAACVASARPSCAWVRRSAISAARCLRRWKGRHDCSGLLSTTGNVGLPLHTYPRLLQRGTPFATPSAGA
jgi:hypothetical protein